MATGTATITIKAKMRNMLGGRSEEHVFTLSNVGNADPRRITLASQASTTWVLKSGTRFIYAKNVSAWTGSTVSCASLLSQYICGWAFVYYNTSGGVLISTRTNADMMLKKGEAAFHTIPAALSRAGSVIDDAPLSVHIYAPKGATIEFISFDTNG